MADEADLSVVLALLQAAFVWKCDDHGLDPRGWPLSCRPEIVVRAVITFLPAWTSSAGILSTSADFPFFNDCTPLLCEGWGGRPLCVSGDISVLIDLRWPCDCTAQSSSVHRYSISRSSVRHFPDRSWTVLTLPCFRVISLLQVHILFSTH